MDFTIDFWLFISPILPLKKGIPKTYKDVDRDEASTRLQGSQFGGDFITGVRDVIKT